jgi:hypothetical protein
MSGRVAIIPRRHQGTLHEISILTTLARHATQNAMDGPENEERSLSK